MENAHLIQPLQQVPTPLPTPPPTPPSTPPPTPSHPILRTRPPPQHQLMRSPILFKREKKAALRRVKDNIENALRNVNAEYVHGQIPPLPGLEITSRRVL